MHWVFQKLAPIFKTIAIVCLTIVATVCLCRLKKLLRVLYLSRQFRGPKAMPFIGNANLFYNLDPVDVSILFNDIMRTYGNSVKIWFGCELSIFMSDLKDVEIILGTSKLPNKSMEYEMLRPWLNDGLLISKGTKWFKRRRVLTPAFHFKILERFVDVFDYESRILVERLRSNEAGDQEHLVEMSHWVNLVTLDIICETAMGVSVHAQTNIDSDYVRAVKTISMVIHKRMFDILYRFDITYKFTKLAREEKKALEILHGFTEKVIVQRREELLKASKVDSSNQNDEDNDIGAKRRMAFLDVLLQSEIDGKPLTNLDIREEVDTFMFEGHDTTSSAITFFFYSVAMYPECQRKCVEEILTIFGKDKEKPVTYENLNKLHYVELCIKETLRMYPSVPLLGRKVTEECEINGKIIPAGTNIGISPIHLGRTEELFPEANIFKPERFDVVTSAEKMNPYAYIPFSAGPRNCIGQKFAMLEIKSIVTNVLRHYEVEYVGDRSEEPPLVGELILRTRDPLMFKIKPRIY